jgi:hypothetical protein
LNNGFNFRNKWLIIRLQKESVSVTFDRVIKTVNGSVSGIKMTTYNPSEAYISKFGLTAIKDNDVNKLHIWHCDFNLLNITTNIHGLKMKGEFKVCEDCVIAKAMQRNV